MGREACSRTARAPPPRLGRRAELPALDGAVTGTPSATMRKQASVGVRGPNAAAVILVVSRCSALLVHHDPKTTPLLVRYNHLDLPPSGPPFG